MMVSLIVTNSDVMTLLVKIPCQYQSEINRIYRHYSFYIPAVLEQWECAVLSLDKRSLERKGEGQGGNVHDNVVDGVMDDLIKRHSGCGILP